MAGNIKGIAIKLAADATEFTAALDSTQTAINKTQKGLNAVNKALKLNPSNMTLLTEKSTLLESKIKDTKTQLDAMKTELSRMDANGVDKTSEEYMSLQRNIIQTESKLKAFNKELLEVKAAASPLGQLGSKFTEVGNKATALGNKMKGISTAAAGVAAAIGALAVKSGQWADELNTTSKQYGVSTKKLQLYSGAAELVDVSTESLSKGMVKLGKNISAADSGTAASSEAFKKLGVSIKDSQGNLKSQDKMLEEVLPALSKVKNQTERNAIANQLFGKSYSRLNPLIEDGGKTYTEYMKTLSSSGIKFVDQDTLDNANQFTDTIDRTKAVATQAFMSMGSQLAAYLLPAMESITTKIDNILGKLTQASPKTLTIIGGIATAIAGIAPGLLIFGKLSTAAGQLTTGLSKLVVKFPAIGTAFKSMLGVFTVNPILGVIAAIGALAVALNAMGVDMSDVGSKIQDFVTNAVNKIVTILPSVIDAISSNLGPIIECAGTIITSLITGLINALPTLISNMPKIISAIVSGLIKAAPKILKAGVQCISQLIKGLIKALPKLKAAALNLAKKIPGWIKNGIKGIVSVGANIVSGIWSGMKNKLGWFKSLIAGWVGNVKSFIKKLFGIHSPSKWAKNTIGKNLALGIGEGFDSSMGTVTKSMKGTLTKSKAQLGLDSGITSDGMSKALSSASLGSTTSNSDNSVSYNFGNITVDASSLEDIATVEDFALMLRRAKAFG